MTFGFLRWLWQVSGNHLKEVVDGNAMVPERPGNGLVWNDKAVARYRMA